MERRERRKRRPRVPRGRRRDKVVDPTEDNFESLLAEVSGDETEDEEFASIAELAFRKVREGVEKSEDPKLALSVLTSLKKIRKEAEKHVRFPEEFVLSVQEMKKREFCERSRLRPLLEEELGVKR